MDSTIPTIADWPLAARVLAMAGFAAITHVVVMALRYATKRFLQESSDRRYRKLKSVASLTLSIAVFGLYFFVFGLILREFGVSLTAYLASASVLGLAIGFGSQGVVQDVVTGLTFIFSDLVDVGFRRAHSVGIV